MVDTSQHARSIPQRYRQHFVDQAYDEYTESDHAVWAEVLARNTALRRSHGRWFPEAYLEGIERMRLHSRVPRIAELNDHLAPTGWQTVGVDGYIPSAAYARLMTMRVFPISRGLRRAEHIDFAPAPDFVHDVLGHLPMLFSPPFRAYLERLAGVMGQAEANAVDQNFFEAVRDMADKRSDLDASRAVVEAAEERLRLVEEVMKHNASPATCLRRIYVWSVEFGLMGTLDAFKIHGAALLSSPAEFRHVCDDHPTLHPYALSVIEHENQFSDPLDRYFVADSFQKLDDVLSEYQRRISFSPASSNAVIQPATASASPRKG